MNEYKPWWDRHDDARFPRVSGIPHGYFGRPSINRSLYVVALIIGAALFLAWSVTL